MTNPDTGHDSEQDDGLALAAKPRAKSPRRFDVVFHNDDYTTMEFVVEALIRFFHKTETEATQIMLTVHHKGHGVAGTYTRDVAETKAAQVSEFAREHGHPLKCTAEPTI